MLTRLRAPLVLVAGIALGVGLTLAVGVWAGLAPGIRPTMAWQRANLFAEVYEHIRRDYVDEVSDEKLMSGAVRGLTAGLDQYSAYLDPKEYEEMRINTAGAYSGIGIEISIEDRVLKVVSTIDQSPAARAGIRSGDIVIAIDDRPVDPAHLDTAVSQMRGKPGEHVKLAIRRDGEKAPLTFNLARRKVQVHSVKTQLLEPGFGYVRISQFSETTADDFIAGMKELQNGAGLRGLVLDLRNNPGGVLEAAVAVADQFLESGVIVSAQGRTPDAQFVLEAQPGDVLHGAPIVVLVNGGSASASEILAGALQDHHRAQLIGQTTFGKGLVQTVMTLEQGGALKLTTSRYHTPSGASINQLGITPDKILGNLANVPPANNSAGSLLREDAEVRIALTELKAQAKQAQIPTGAAIKNALSLADHPVKPLENTL